MKPIDPEGLPGEARTFAKDQPQYNPLPTTVDGDIVWTRWSLDAIERAAILDGANIELSIMTFGRPLQPLRMRVQGVEESIAAIEITAEDNEWMNAPLGNPES